MFNNKTVPLATLLDELRGHVDSLRKALALTNSTVLDSAKHAKNLRDLADELKALLRNLTFADTALKASRVYAKIVSSIYDALEAARVANNTAHEANMKVCVFLLLWFYLFIYSYSYSFFILILLLIFFFFFCIFMYFYVINFFLFFTILLRVECGLLH